MTSLRIKSGQREEMIDITQAAQGVISAAGWISGALMLFCPHTTCGLTINENADPDVRRDLISFFRGIAPREHGWAHCEGNSDAHIRSSLLGVSLLVPVESGRIQLGTWQGIYLYEGDGPRQRSLWLQFLKAQGADPRD